MYNIGDKIVYPMYGAGVIEDFEHKEFNGSNHMYYVLRIPIGDLKIMVSVDKADTLGIRQIHTSQEMTDILNSTDPTEMSNNWSVRYKENIEKIKTGDLVKVTEVYKSLILRERIRGLSTAEKKILSNAKQILLSEIILAKEMERPQAETFLEGTIA